MTFQGLQLTTESDVEQKIIMPLLSLEQFLGIPVPSIQTKEYLPPTNLDKSAGKGGGYFPDYSIWIYGLPVLIVEAKAPGIQADAGYREASLYSRHLNQSYPSGCNPCLMIIATNGTELLCGTWDSAPKLRLQVALLAPGSAGTDELQKLCSASVLQQHAHKISLSLRAKRVFPPFEAMGGQPVLNARLAPNSFARELSPILRKYFSSTASENIHEIARTAYISSDEATEYDKILGSLLKDRMSINQDVIIQRLDPTQKGEKHVAQVISHFRRERPESGQLQIIQGSVGAGKSLFIRRYRDLLQPDSDGSKTRWAFIDFNAAESLSETGPATTWLYQSFCDAFQAENSSVDLTTTEALRSVFAGNIEQRQGLYDELERASPSEASITKTRDLLKWRDDPKEFARGIAQYVLNKREEVLVTVMDNVDRLDVASQLNAFQLAISFMSLTKCFVILQMRDETYERYKGKPPLDTYRSGIALGAALLR